MRFSISFVFLIALNTFISAQQNAKVENPSQAPFQTGSTTLTEPGIYQLSDLFQKADSVVLASVVSGDTESYDATIYKAKVLKSYKGATPGQAIHFGPYEGEKLGSEYILFLRNVSKPAIPKNTTGFNYGTIPYAAIFNEGYSSMIVSYECIFDGDDINQKCDYGVRVCTDYIKLPKSVPAFPAPSEDKEAPPFGCRWVRKSVFVKLLETYAKSISK